MGQTLNSYLKARVNYLEKTIMMIDFFEYRMNILMMPVHEVVYMLKCESIYSELTYLSSCADFIDRGYDFPEAWEKSIYESKAILKKEEKNKLMSFGKSIGKTDAESQHKTIELYRDYFIRQSEYAKEERKKYAVPIMTTCFMMGFAVLILII